MTTEKIKKYITERKYHLTETEIKTLFESPQVIAAEELLDGRACKIITNDGYEFAVMIKPYED